MINRTTVAITLVCVAGLGCTDASRPPPPTSTSTAEEVERANVGDRVTWTGVAENHKVGAYLRGPEIYIDVPGTYWPKGADGEYVRVKGALVERHDLPVFIADPDSPGSPCPPAQTCTRRANG